MWADSQLRSAGTSSIDLLVHLLEGIGPGFETVAGQLEMSCAALFGCSVSLLSSDLSALMKAESSESIFAPKLTVDALTLLRVAFKSASKYCLLVGFAWHSLRTTQNTTASRDSHLRLCRILAPLACSAAAACTATGLTFSALHLSGPPRILFQHRSSFTAHHKGLTEPFVMSCKARAMLEKRSRGSRQM